MRRRTSTAIALATLSLLCGCVGRTGSALRRESGASEPAPQEVRAVLCSMPAAVDVARWAAIDPEPPPPPDVAPPVRVYGERPGPVPAPAFVPAPEPASEEARVGPNAQPEWTTKRRFATTRTYVLAPWQVEVESWWKGKYPKHGGSEHLFQEEIEIGLPCRFQLDLYANLASAPGEDLHYEGTQVEVRHALAPWGRLPANPTLYGEWKFNRGDVPDAWEAKILLSDEFRPHVHWGFNAFYEREVSGEEAIEMGATAAVSWTLLDPCLSVGVEAQYERTTVQGARDDPENEFLLGPSVQWRPTARTHLDVVPLLGLTSDSPAVEVFVIFGIDLGGGGSDSYSGPASSRSR